MRRSLTRSLAIRCSILALLGLFAAIAEHFARDGVELHYELDALSEQLVASLERVEDGYRLVPDEALLARLRRINDLRLVLLDSAARPVFAWRMEPGRIAADELVFRLGELSTEGQFEIAAEGGRRYGYVHSLEGPDGTVFRVAAERGPAEMRDRWYWVIREINGEYGPFMLVSALLSILVVTVTVRRAMRPLGQVSTAAAAIVPGSGARLDASSVPAEVSPLVEAMNGALSRLQQALERERRFTADVAHTLRTPIAALRARIEGASEGAERQALLRVVGRIERLTEQLLFKARLEAGALDEQIDFDLANLAREVGAETASLLQSQNKTLVVRTPDRPVPRRGSPLAIEQAILNLLDNAAKASPPDSSVELRVEPDGSVLVRDAGPGLPENEAHELFAPFRRGRSSRWQGAGLGLAIVAEAVRRHGGRTVARNRPEGGAEIGFRLPAPESGPQARRKDIADLEQGSINAPARRAA